MSEHLSRTPLHITLGLFTNFIDMIEAAALSIDREFALNVADGALLAAYHEATAEVTVAEHEAEGLQEKIDGNEAVMRICVGKDEKAGNMRRRPSVYKPEDMWAVKYQTAKRQADEWEAARKKAVARAAAAKKKVDTAMEALVRRSSS